MLRGRSVIRGLASQTLCAILLIKLQFTRTRVVRTLHNVSPHEPGDIIEKWLLQGLDRRTDAWVIMNSDESVRNMGLHPSAAYHIKHGDFRGWYQDHVPETRRPDRGRALFFGQMRPYKGIESLIKIYRNLPQGTGLHLELTGQVRDEVLREEIVEAAQSSPTISANLAFTPDADLVDSILRANLVILPYARMLNSGAALTALSLGRPILVPRSESNVELQKEVGEFWVKIYEDELNEQDILRALDEVPIERVISDQPEFDGRDWTDIALQHLQAYQDA